MSRAASAAAAMPPLGALAIGPEPIWLLTGVELTGQSGMWSRHWPLPDDALLDGLSLHFQSLVLDAGAIGFQETPDFSNLRYGAGFGVRYKLPFGPIRADIAFPLDRRDGDADFQIYVSIGQAF